MFNYSRILTRTAFSPILQNNTRNIYFLRQNLPRSNIYLSNTLHDNNSAHNIDNKENCYILQQRSYVMGDFLKNTLKKIRENVKKEPEFGGKVKQIQETSKNVKEVAKSTREHGSKYGTIAKDKITEVFTKTSDAVKGTTKTVYEKTKKSTQEYSKPIIDEVTETTKKVIDNETLKETSENIAKVAEKTSKIIEEVSDKTSKAYRSTADKTNEYVAPVSDSIKKSKVVKDYKHLSSALNKKSQFNATPGKKKKLKIKTFNTSLVAAHDSKWALFKKRLFQQWNELGDSNSRLSYVVEAVDSLSESWKKISSSHMGVMISNLQRDYPDFDIDKFQEWVTYVLVPKVLTSKTYNEFVETHSGDLIKNLYKTKQLPLPWKLINISSSEIFPQDQETNSYKFFFSIRGQVKEIEKETNKEKIYNIVLIVATKLNEEKVWVLTEFQEVEKREALF